MKTPFKDARIIATSADPDDYRRQPGKRGDADFVMSRGELCNFTACPSRWLRGYSRKDSGATDFGSLVDALLLCPQAARRYVVRPATYEAVDKKGVKTGEVKPWRANAGPCEDWLDLQVGREVVSPDDWAEAKQTILALERDPDINDILASSKNSVWCEAWYVDQATGVQVRVKILIDVLPTSGTRWANWIFDLKTSRDASPCAWGRSVYALGYHVQAALYSDIYAACVPEDDRNTWGHLVVENFAPFQTAKRFLSVEMVELGRIFYRQALARYCRCLATGTWPDYDTDRRGIMPGWGIVEPETWMQNAETVFEPLQEPKYQPEREQDEIIP